MKQLFVDDGGHGRRRALFLDQSLTLSSAIQGFQGLSKTYIGFCLAESRIDSISRQAATPFSQFIDQLELERMAAEVNGAEIYSNNYLKHGNEKEDGT